MAVRLDKVYNLFCIINFKFCIEYKFQKFTLKKERENKTIWGVKSDELMTGLFI